jgi:hypothetical protein
MGERFEVGDASCPVISFAQLEIGWLFLKREFHPASLDVVSLQECPDRFSVQIS